MHLHLVNGSKQIKISWPPEAKAMAGRSVISNSGRVEISLIKCHRRKENSVNNVNRLECKVQYQTQ